MPKNGIKKKSKSPKETRRGRTRRRNLSSVAGKSNGGGMPGPPVEDSQVVETASSGSSCNDGPSVVEAPGE